VDTSPDQLQRRGPFNLLPLRGPADPGHASDRARTTDAGQSEDIDPEELTEVYLTVAGATGLLLLIVVAAIVVFTLQALHLG
jgi:hypothetical protein